MTLPTWLDRLRRDRIGKVLRDDPRTNAVGLLGVPASEVFDRVIGGGQADFDAPIDGLTGADRALFYAHYNQLAHLEELVTGLGMLLNGFPTDEVTVLDVGCGPFTGGLAFGAVCGSACTFKYIGVDRSASMRALGETLAQHAVQIGSLANVGRQWVVGLPDVVATAPPGWRPVLVIVSYLLASASVEPAPLVEELDAALLRLGRGPVALLYTNSPKDWPNRNFPAFQEELEKRGFSAVVNASGRVRVNTASGMKDRALRYALFHRQALERLSLGAV